MREKKTRFSVESSIFLLTNPNISSITSLEANSPAINEHFDAIQIKERGGGLFVIHSRNKKNFVTFLDIFSSGIPDFRVILIFEN